MPANPVTYTAFLNAAEVRAVAVGRRRRERAGAFVVGAGTAVVLVALLVIPLFLIRSLLPWAGLAAGTWQHLGVLFAGSVKAAVAALVVAVPIGLATAIFTAHFGAPRLRAFIKPALEILEAIPTVVLGLVAAATLAPWLKTNLATLLLAVIAVPAALMAGGLFFGAKLRRRETWLPLWLLPLLLVVVAAIVAAFARSDQPVIAVTTPWNAVLIGLALGLAAVPLVFSIAEDALTLIPSTHTQAALALGATRWQALTSMVLPAAASGLVAAVVLGASRCIGETMIVLMASGNTPLFDVNPLTGLRSISAELAIGLPEAAPPGQSYRVLLLAALVLFALTFVLNFLAERVRATLRRQAGTAAHGL